MEDAANGINITFSKNLLSYINRYWYNRYSYNSNEQNSSLYKSLLQFQEIEEGCNSLKNININDYGSYDGLTDEDIKVDNGLDCITNKLNKMLPNDTIQYNKKVVNVKWSGVNSVQITVVDLKTKELSVVDASLVVSTLPLGVLKEVHEKMFNPPLPIKKTNAIER